uniref:Uncharacterized protein n=1 Tax=Oryza punctata TaxID=4537 RepID=A0A0E0LFV1_ORYPU
MLCLTSSSSAPLLPSPAAGGGNVRITIVSSPRRSSTGKDFYGDNCEEMLNTVLVVASL